MTRLHPLLAALAALPLALASRGAAADHLPTPAPAAYRVLVPVEAMPPAHRAAYILAIREELAAHGYDPGPPLAVLDPDLAAAIWAYQQDAGLPADGVASKELLEHLIYALPKVYAARGFPGAGAAVPLPSRRPAPLAPPPEPGPEPGPGYWPDDVTEEPLPEAPPPPDEATAAPLPAAPPPPDEATAAPLPAAPPAGTEAAPEAAPQPTIGGVVSQVQAELKRRGYYAGAVDGRFTPETSAAVRRFQDDNGLPADGVISRALLDALEG